MEFSLKFQPPHFPSHTYTAVAGNKFKVLFSKNSFSFMIYFHLIYNLHALFLPQPHFPPFLFRRYAIFTQFCDISLYLSISCFLLFLTSYCRKCVLLCSPTWCPCYSTPIGQNIKASFHGLKNRVQSNVGDALMQPTFKILVKLIGETKVHLLPHSSSFRAIPQNIKGFMLELFSYID